MPAPPRPPPELQVEEEGVVDGIYRRQLVSYNVEEGERAHAYLGLPLDPFLAQREPLPCSTATSSRPTYGSSPVLSNHISSPGSAAA